MGIFSFLNRDQDYEDIDLTSVMPAEEPGPELPDLCREMPIEILDEGGQVLNTGLITERKGREIAMGRHPGGLSFKICEPGSTVFVRGCDNRMVQFYLRATVVESSRILMRLKDLAPEVRENQRGTFRLAEQCTLVDISTGGCCIVSEYLHGEGEVLRLRVKLEDYVAMDFVGEVIRVVDCGKDGFRCGILFAQLTEEEITSLTKMLFNLQLGNRREHSRSETGHW